MSTPHKALSALVCIVVAFALGFVARLPALMERLDSRFHPASYELRVAPGGTTRWGAVRVLPVR